MSLKDARKFVVDFYSDPTLRLKMVQTKLNKGKSNLSNYGKLSLIKIAARERDYNFTMDELKEANNCTFGEIEDLELSNVAGGLATNKYALSQSFPIKAIGDLFYMDMDQTVNADSSDDLEAD